MPGFYMGVKLGLPPDGGT